MQIVDRAGNAPKRPTVFHPEEDDRLSNQHAHCRRGDTDGHANHDWQKDEGEHPTSKGKHGMDKSVMVAMGTAGRTELPWADAVMRR